jgi:hypothetical protein
MDMFKRNMICRSLAAALLVSASTNLYADLFSVSLVGDVLVGDETFATLFDYGLTAGDTISAVGTVTAASGFDVSGGTGTFVSLTIDLNGTLFTLADASNTPKVTFDGSGTLTDFFYTSAAIPGFNSSGEFFDNINGEKSMFGLWRVEDAVVTPVPEAETYAMMLAGLGLVGFMGLRRKQALAA